MTKLEIIILTALLIEERHGYAIREFARSITSKRHTVTTLYTTISRLHSAEMIERVGKRVGKEDTQRLRKTYKVTALGRVSLSSELIEFQQMYDLVNELL